MEDEQSFLDDHDYYEFRYDSSQDWIQKSTACCPSFIHQYLAQGTPQQRKVKCGLVSLVAVLLVAGIACLVIGIVIVASSSSAAAHSPAASSGRSSVSSHDDDDSPPTLNIPASFSSAIAEVVKINSNIMVDMTGFMWSDSTTRHRRIDYVEREPGNSGYEHQKLEYTNHNSMHLVDNGVCREFPGRFGDAFSWTDKATLQSSAIIQGEHREFWTYSGPVPAGVAYYSLVADGDTPVFLNVTVDNGIYLLNEQITFTNFVPMQISSDIFGLPGSCTNGGSICDGNGAKEVPMILHHPLQAPSLENQNLADALGFGARICRQMESSSGFYSFFDINVDTSYGPYGMCYQGSCNGALDSTVGRAATNKVKEMEGQCVDNSDVGNWYSLMGASQCEDGQSIEDGTCAWEVVRLKKTITSECLNGLGVPNSCRASPGLPYTQVAEIIFNAFSQCPDVSTDDQDQGKSIYVPASIAPQGLFLVRPLQ